MKLLCQSNYHFDWQSIKGPRIGLDVIDHSFFEADRISELQGC